MVQTRRARLAARRPPALSGRPLLPLGAPSAALPSSSGVPAAPPRQPRRTTQAQHAWMTLYNGLPSPLVYSTSMGSAAQRLCGLRAPPWRCHHRGQAQHHSQEL